LLRYRGHYEKLWRHQSGGFIANELDDTEELRALRPTSRDGGSAANPGANLRPAVGERARSRNS